MKQTCADAARCARLRLAAGLSVLAVACMASSAHAAVSDFAMGMAASGSLPFDGSAGAGLDNSPSDAIVRTNDQVMYRVSYTLAPEAANSLVTLEMGATTLPAGYTGPANPRIAYFRATDIPSGADGCRNISATPVSDPPPAGVSGVTADGLKLFCAQPQPLSGSNLSFSYHVSGGAPNGATIAAPTVTYQSDGNPARSNPRTLNEPSHPSTPTYGAPVVTVSAAPRWKVKKTRAAGGSVFIPRSGPQGEDGYLVAYNIGIYAEGSRRGLEALKPDFTLEDNFDNGAKFPGLRLVDWNIDVPGFARALMGAGKHDGCGNWDYSLTRLGNGFDNTYFEVNDTGAASTRNTTVANGGDCKATSVNAGAKTATLTVTGVDFSLKHYPTRKGTGPGTVVNTSNLLDSANQWWVASKSVLLWAPVTDFTPNVYEEVINKVSLSGTSVTGQANPPSSGEDKALVRRTTGGSISKLYSLRPGGSRKAGVTYAIADPSLSDDTYVRQAGPGQHFDARLHVINAGTDDMPAGYICERIDNTRLSFANALPSSDSRVDVKTGILTLPQAGSAAVTWELGVGGNGISASGTWNSYNTTTTEYPDVSPPVAQSGSAQSDSTCGDSDGVTWYDSIASLQAAGKSLKDITRVRGSYSTYGKAVSTLYYIPLQANATYAFSGTDNAPGGAFAQGDSTMGAIAPNQAMWQIAPGNIRQGSDVMRIRETEYIAVSKSENDASLLDGRAVAPGSLLDYKITVNAASSTADHTTTVTVWDVLPQHMSYMPGTSTLGGTAIADPDCSAAGTTPSGGPFDANSVPTGYTACKWTLPNQPVKHTELGSAAANLPPLRYQAQVSLSAPNGVQLLNSTFADSTANGRLKAIYRGANGFVCKNGQSCSFSNWKVRTRAETTVLLKKSVSHAEVPLNTGFTYTLYYAATGTHLDQLRILDVLPYASDGRSSSYAGALKLAAPIAAPVAGHALTADPAMVVLYTSNAPAHINRNSPNDASHNVQGTGSNSASSTNWCTVAQFGSANCPAAIGDATAFMALAYGRTGTVPINTAYELIVPVVASGNSDGNQYVNDYRADSATLLARNPGSNRVLTKVKDTNTFIAGRVYREASSPANTTDDGNATDPGISGVTLTLACTNPVHTATTTTGADGSYRFGGLTAGAQCTVVETQPTGYTNAYNTRGTAATGDTGSSGTGNSTITIANLPATGSTGNNFAETQSGGGSRVAVSGRVYREASSPANTTDDGNGTDPGISGVTVALACTSPAHSATTTTGADGSYSFTNVPAGANCTITETQPTGYTNAYNTRGAGGTADTGGSGTGNSTITLTVPATGSTGNNFAETQSGGGSRVAVSGRVYREASSPANTTDDGNGTDPGISGVTVALACTSPAHSATTTTGADGSYSFANVPAGASCTITETQPSGYTNAYNTRGAGGTADTGGSGTGNSTITLTVPATGSTGNNFAETQSGPPTPGAPVSVPTLGWPMLAALSALMAGVGGWRRRRAGA